jgi:glucosamine-6-phosphate deaminase
MKPKFISLVEQSYFNQSGRESFSTKIPYIVVPTFPNLGLFTALRFLEWAAENPNGVISLPTGKTPEHFIKWTQYFINNWDKAEAREKMSSNGLILEKKPDLSQLHFVQIDEFYPIDPKQHNSFFDYVQNYYVKGFGLNPDNALLINCEEIQLKDGQHFSQVFPGNKIDLSLRNRDAKNAQEKIQQESLFMIDDWCSKYEQKIRSKGGIGFFLGGIGPDGHIGFNTRGSDHNSTTRLTATNFETQAASAGDLGGIEVARDRLVITIGLDTIAHNPEGVSIIFVAGEAKAPIVKNALENEANVLYPATVLQGQKNARFYITEGSSIKLEDSIERFYKKGEWTFQKTERAIYDLCEKIDKYAHKLELEDLKKDRFCAMIPNLSMDSVQEVIEDTQSKITKGLTKQKNQVFLHTGPHHDDIMLGLYPTIIPQVREASNDFHFSILTSGFTAVTNNMLSDMLQLTLQLIGDGKIQMLKYPDFFESGYKFKWDKDVSHYLNKVAGRDEPGRLRGACHRVTRVMVEIYRVKSKKELTQKINEILSLIEQSYDGEKNPPDIQKLKGMLREFEEELVWAHYGVQVKNISHLRLGFYTGDIFTQQPERTRDVLPILEMLRKIKPSVVSLALDPEGSGPDTHYKVLQAIAEALRQWSKEHDMSDFRVIGYRNVWFKFQPYDSNVFTPVSLNSMAVLESSFKHCYISQVKASFPSHELDGPFSELSQKIWVEQFKRVQLILGKDFFYEHNSPKLRSTHGMVFHKEMELSEFLQHARDLEVSMEG